MDTPNSNAMPIDHGPMAGWDISITHIPHGIDPMDDLYVLDLWPPGADEPAHAFETYRYAYGWSILNTALVGADDEMRAALDWWTANHTTPAAHRILVAIDTTTWASKAEIAARLNLSPDDLEPGKRYGSALADADKHQLTTWSNTRATPLVALTPSAYDLIHPDDLDTAARAQQSFATAFNAPEHMSPDAPVHRPRAASAFPRVTHLQRLDRMPGDHHVDAPTSRPSTHLAR